MAELLHRVCFASLLIFLFFFNYSSTVNNSETLRQMTNKSNVTAEKYSTKRKSSTNDHCRTFHCLQGLRSNNYTEMPKLGFDGHWLFVADISSLLVCHYYFVNPWRISSFSEMLRVIHSPKFYWHYCYYWCWVIIAY